MAELALAAGASLDLETNCDVFLHALIEHAAFDYAAVWMRDEGPEPGGYRLVRAEPAAEASEAWLPVTHPLVRRLSGAGCFSEPAAGEGGAGVWAVFALGEAGFLQLRSRRDEPLTPSETARFEPLFAKFAASLEACRSHRRLLDELRAHRRTEDEVVRLKNFFEQALEKMPAQLVVFDAEGRFLYANPSAVPDAERRRWIVGKTNMEYLARRGLDPKVARRRHAKLMEVVRKKRKVRFEESLVEEDGALRHFVRFLSPVCDAEGRVEQVLGFGLDVTERRRVRAALRESEGRQRAILVSALDGIITFDETSRILEFNPAAERLFGYRREEVLGKIMPEYLVPPHLWDDYRRGLARLVAFGEEPGPVWRVEMTCMRADGGVFPVELAVISHRRDDGRCLYTAYVRDVTERRRAERELLEANRLAEQSVRAKERLLAHMSSGMRAPLSAVVGMTHLLMQTDPSPAQKKYLNAIKFSADNLLVLINDMLDVAKMEAGKLEFETVPFRPREVVRGVVDTLSFQARERGLALAAEVEERLPPVLLGDPVRLHQILLNLVGYVIKNAGRGGVTVRVRAARADGQVRLRFVTGTSTEEAGELFESFMQVRDGAGRPLDGADPGPAFVHELVEGMGGEIVVTREEGAEPALGLTLPFAEVEGEGDPLGEAGTPGRQDVRLTDARILVMEGNEMSRFVLRSMLEQWGARVDAVADGHAALERLREASYDLALVDLRAPGMDGYETTRHIREEMGLSAQTLPVLALTASTLIDHREEIAAVGINDFILKPFNPNDLRLRLVFHLGIHTPPPVAPRYVNLTFLEEHAFGNNAFVVKMIDLFMQQAPDLLRDLQQARAAEDWERVTFVAHKMKSSARMLGIEALTGALQVVERHAGQAASREDLPQWIEEAIEVCRAALEELRVERRKYAPEVNPA
ncbi:PAS domain S-box protein [Rhodocaloribacter sp.]